MINAISESLHYLSIQVEHEYLVLGESEHSALLNVLK